MCTPNVLRAFASQPTIGGNTQASGFQQIARGRTGITGPAQQQQSGASLLGGPSAPQAPQQQTQGGSLLGGSIQGSSLLGAGVAARRKPSNLRERAQR